MNGWLRFIAAAVIWWLGGMSVVPAATLNDLSGVWRMQGYGRILDISPKRVTAYDITDISCVKTEAGNYDRIEPDGDHFTAYEPGGITRYGFVRIGALPERCRKPDAQKARDPRYNFSVFGQAFRENYAFFALHKVDWDKLLAQYQPRVTARTSDKELFAVMSDILAKLKDGHVTLTAGKRDYGSGSIGELQELWMRTSKASDWDEAEPLYERAVSNHVRSGILHNQAQSGAMGILTWGWAEPGIGYLNVGAMELPEDARGRELPLPRQLALVDDAMRHAMRDLKSARVLMVDARFNDGGYDAIALRIMGYLIDKDYVAFTKKAVEGKGFTQAQDIHMTPVGKRNYVCPLVYMQGGSTVSAAEIFTLAMIVRPKATRIGRSTYGVLSDELYKTLPKGWKVSLSNEVYVASDGHAYESVGIPPQIKTELSDKGGFRTQLDRDFAAALDVARKSAAGSAPCK